MKLPINARVNGHWSEGAKQVFQTNDRSDARVTGPTVNVARLIHLFLAVASRRPEH